MPDIPRPAWESTRECRTPHPDGAYRCTLPAGHSGDHKHAYSGPLIGGWRRGTEWK